MGQTYIHTCRSYVHTPRDFTNGAFLAWRLRRRISTVMFTCSERGPLARRFVRFWASGSKVHKNEGFPAMDADEPLGKIWRLGGKIRNRTNTQKTHKQTVTDASTPCLSACVDNKNVGYRKQIARDVSCTFSMRPVCNSLSLSVMLGCCCCWSTRLQSSCWCRFLVERCRLRCWNAANHFSRSPEVTLFARSYIIPDSAR